VQGNGVFVFKEKLKILKYDLNFLNREAFGNVFQNGEEIKKRLH